MTRWTKRISNGLRLGIAAILLGCFALLSGTGYCADGPIKGEERFPFLIADSGKKSVILFDAKGEAVWQHPAANTYDVWLLPKGEVLFSTGHGAKKISLDGKVLLDYAVEGEVFSCQPLPDGRTLVAECTARRLVELDAAGKVVKEIKVQGNPGHAALRIARKLDNGNYLVAHASEQTVKEYDGESNVVRTIKTPYTAFMAIRLKNGNTLISTEHAVLEVNPSDKVVWQLNDTDIPEMGSMWMTGIERLENGNTLICNWLGHGRKPHSVPIFEVTPEKKVVWQFTDTLATGNVTHIQTLKKLPKLPKGLTVQPAKEVSKILTNIRNCLNAANLPALRASLEDSSAKYPDKYNHLLLEVLEAHETTLAKLATAAYRNNFSATDEAEAALDSYDKFRRNALIANPIVSGQQLLFVVRAQYVKDHHNTATMFQTGEINTGSFRGGGAMKAIDLKTRLVRTLIETPSGLIRDPEVSFDGKKIIFSMRKDIKDDYHLYEINADGTGLHQLTSAPGVFDIDPLYMPDGGIVFSSSREPKYCMCNRHIMANLFTMEGDGANIHQIGKSTLFEGHSSLMPDGRVLYDRWEYIDRNFGDAQGLWTVNPDGTNHAIYWGNNTSAPGGVIDARPIPGTQKVICIFGSCHDRPWGALTIIDRRLALDGRDAVVQMWPPEAVNHISTEGTNKWDAFMNLKIKYEDPYPLNENYFLASRMTGNGEETALYLLDTFGNEILLHAEAPGCFDPMPIAPRPRPMQVPTRRDFENKTGDFYVMDVYNGTHMKGIERGTVKYLRVIESPEKRTWTQTSWGGQGTIAPAMNWHDFSNKRILGTVPVEEDGSAHFSVPADRFVYFQLLDKDKMMVQSMRSGTMVQSGEQTGCVGCHDQRHSAPPPIANTLPLALKRKATELEGWFGQPRLFNFTSEVQPILTKNCVECHDFGEEAGKKLILAADRTLTFNVAYNELWRKKYVNVVGAGIAETQAPYTWGAHASKLAQVIRDPKGHEDVKLSPEEMERITTWIDINAPYYPDYDSAYPDNLTGRSPLNNTQINRLQKLTGVNFPALTQYNRNLGPQVSFDRPELSPCLASLKGKPEMQEALAIIQEGAQALKTRPRADMPGFVPAETHQQRQTKYANRLNTEQNNRTAIRENTKLYDPGIGSVQKP